MANRGETSHSYYVVAVDYGRPYVGKSGPSGIEAIVDPEMTRRGAVDAVREAQSRNHEIAFIHHITLNDFPQDVTAELIAEASGTDDDRPSCYSRVRNSMMEKA